MRGLELLEGEVVRRRVLAHPLDRLADYGPGLALAGWAALLAWLLAGPAAGLAPWLDARAGPAAGFAMLVLWWVGLAAATGPFALLRGAAWPLAYGVGVAVLGGFAATALGLPDPSAGAAAAALPALTALAAAGLLGWAEVLRRTSPVWVWTNLRLLRREGLRRVREEGWRLPKLGRVEAALRGPRVLDFGDLLVPHGAEALRIRGVRPATRLRDELEMHLHTAPEAPYLGQQRDVADKVGRLLRPGDAPPR